MLEPHYVLVADRSMDLDLAHKLLLGARLDQGLLADYLCSKDGSWTFAWRLGVYGLELVALRETAFTQELALEVFLYLDFSVVLGDLFFNDLGDTLLAC